MNSFNINELKREKSNAHRNEFEMDVENEKVPWYLVDKQQRRQYFGSGEHFRGQSRGGDSEEFSKIRKIFLKKMAKNSLF